MRECCRNPSSWRAEKSLPEYLEEYGIVAIEGVDTRKITRMLRTEGAMKAVLSTADHDHERLVQKAKDSPDMAGSDYVRAVSIAKPHEWNPGAEGRFRVVAFDYGVKYNSLRLLAKGGCQVTVLRRGSPQLRPRRCFPIQWTWRSGCVALHLSRRTRAVWQETHFRDMPGTSDSRPRLGRYNLQTQVRPPGRQPARYEPHDGPCRDQRAEPRLCRRCGFTRSRRGDHYAYQLERRICGRTEPQRTAHLQRAIPSRSVSRPP